MTEGEKCPLCKDPMEHKYNAMKEWDVKGVMCGKCYSKRIAGHYPGEHVRVNLDKK